MVSIHLQLAMAACYSHNGSVSRARLCGPDEPRPSLERSEVLAAAPSVEDDRFRVPRIGSEAP